MRVAGKGARGRPARIGVYGGTFNPIHLAHLILAEEIRERLRLSRVLFVPSARPPHKRDRMPTGPQRLAMVRAALRGNPAFAPLDAEVRRGGTSFTIDTLRVLEARHPGAALFFLIGTDAFEEINTWHEAGLLCDHAHFVVFPRAGRPLRDPRPFLPPPWGAAAPRPAGAGIDACRLAGGRRILLVQTEVLSISASAVRRRAARGLSLRYLVPDPVARYIARHGLYGTPRQGG